MSTKLLRAARRSRSSIGVPVALEALESRTLLSAAVAGVHAEVRSSPRAALAVVAPSGPIVLTNSIVSSSLPTSLALTTKSSKAFKVQVSVANSGTGTTAKGAKVTVTAVLHPSTGADVVIGTKSQAYVKVAGGTGSKTVTVTVKLPTTLSAGSYTLETKVAASGFTPTSTNVATGSAITLSTSTTPTGGGGNFLGKLGNVIRLTDLIDSNVDPVPGVGTTTTTHWHFVDEKNQIGELFLIQNVGLLSQAADATINFFPDNALGAGSVAMKGKDASAAASVGTTFTFGKTGSISVTTDSYTGSTCKASRAG